LGRRRALILRLSLKSQVRKFCRASQHIAICHPLIVSLSDMARYNSDKCSPESTPTSTGLAAKMFRFRVRHNAPATHKAITNEKRIIRSGYLIVRTVIARTYKQKGMPVSTPSYFANINVIFSPDSLSYSLGTVPNIYFSNVHSIFAANGPMFSITLSLRDLSSIMSS
jgi:hypothetical protein